MKQLNKEQAEKVFTSAVWDLWSDAQIVQFQLFQDRLCVPWDVFHKAIENELGRLPKELREVHIRNNALQGAHQNLSTFQLYTLSYYYKSLGFNISRYVRSAQMKPSGKNISYLKLEK